ncbi:P-loop containing nucleoside triphosphate hydrolase protein, partial [Rhizoctonia solani]
HAADERIVEFSLDHAEKMQSQAETRDRMIGAAYKEMKTCQTSMKELMKELALRDIPQDHFEKHLLADYPLHYEELFTSPPDWIYSLALQVAEDEAGWTTVGSSPQDFSMLRFWMTARDIEFLRPPPNISKRKGKEKEVANPNRNFYEILSENREPINLNEDSEEHDIVSKHQEFVSQYLYQHGIEEIPPIPETDRPVEELINDSQVWKMSVSERQTLYNTWYMVASDFIRESQVEHFESLRRNHANALKRYQEIQDQSRVNILQKAHIVGCTTTGAAKVVPLLSGMSPKVMIVEEAGQVLESHILATLVPSVEQIIMIGDPLQLRPNVNNYKLSIENRETGSIYRFDQSLMERLHKSGFPMSQLNVQRRMRPAISSLIRNTLYPKLEDHLLVQNYPDVRGVHKNIFFVSHTHKEAGGGEDAVSKYNQYELDMIYDLVLHLLKQGCYNSSRNIIILSAYLGQIPKIRKRLQNVVTIVVDERDAELLEQLGLDEEDSTPVQQVQASSRVLIRTLDNFQGEEGEIIILSLVRNNGTVFDGDAASLQYAPGTKSRIGFLKSDNRVNVGLSRAKHGLYMFGNAPELARSSQMWSTVLKELNASGSVGAALPISCYQHPEDVVLVDQPGKLEIISPDGHAQHYYHVDIVVPISATLTIPTIFRLNAMSGVSDFAQLLLILVIENASSVPRDAEIVCSPFQILHSRVAIHIPVPRAILQRCEKKSRVYTWSASNFRHASIQPTCPVTKIQLHTSVKNPVALIIRAALGPATLAVGIARRLTLRTTIRHIAKIAAKLDINVLDHAMICVVKSVRMMLVKSLARTPAIPIVKKNFIVCGEPCVNQVCRVCAPDSQLDAVVDMILQLTLRDLDDSDSLDNTTITLRCGHTFTVETLDGITHIGDFYIKDPDGKWIQAITPETHGENRVRPVCPTCRGDIDALRYGRVCKSSNLAILQHNISSKLSKLLRVAQGTLAEALVGIEPAITLAAEGCIPFESPSPAKSTKATEALEILLRKQPELPTPSKTLEALDEYHGLTPAYTKLWKGVVKKLLQAYRQAQQVTTHRDSSIQTYEASLATLFEEEMEYLASNPARAPRNIEQRALQLARMRIGQPPPRASLRFTIEAFWVTIRILISLAETANQASKTIRNRDSSIQNCVPWSNLAEYFLKRAVNDSQTALKLAEGSESWNKAAKCQLIVMQAHFELVAHQCRTVIDHKRLTSAIRADLIQLCSKELESAQVLRIKVSNDYISRGANDPQGRAIWIDENFLTPTLQILNHWDELKKAVESGEWYSTISKEENRDIMRALMAGSDHLSHTGHFYECINGHPYVIGECGGAIQRSTCPECGAAIGGSGHAVDAGNRHARQFVELAREDGVQASPWAWGPGRG